MATLIELLVKIQLIDERQQVSVLSRAKSTSGGHIVQQIAEKGYATEGTIARAISVELGLPRIDVQQTPPEAQALALLDARLCAERFILPVALRDNDELLWLAMADPTDQDVIGLVRRRTQKRVRPAVASPTEILRAVRTCYGAAGAGMEQQPEEPPAEKLNPIELREDTSAQPFEVVNVGEDISGAALSRLAEQLGVAVPDSVPSRTLRGTRSLPTPVQIPLATPPRETPAPTIPPQTDPRLRALRGVNSLDDLFRTAPPGPITGDDLGPDDAMTLEALRASLEKGAQVLRTVVELCVEKGAVGRDDLKRKTPR